MNVLALAKLCRANPRRSMDVWITAARKSAGITTAKDEAGITAARDEAGITAAKGNELDVIEIEGNELELSFVNTKNWNCCR